MSLPWRGPGPGRPELPLPPDKLPMRRDGHWRKRWRYVGAFGDELLLCAARINVGPLGQTFWAIWDRTERRLWERTATLMPGARGDVWTEGREGDGLVLHSADEGSVVRIEAKHPRGGRGSRVPALRHREVGRGGLPDQRRPVRLDAKARGRARRVRRPDRRGAASRPRPGASRTSPRATTRTTRSGAGRPVSARPPTGDRSAGTSSAASTIRPSSPSAASGSTASRPSPGRSSFDGLEAIRFDEGSRLDFAGECERHAGGEPLRRPLHVPTAAWARSRGPCPAASRSRAASA